MEADLIKMRLESEEIDSYLKSDNAGGAFPYLTMTPILPILIPIFMEKFEDRPVSNS